MTPEAMFEVICALEAKVAVLKGECQSLRNLWGEHVEELTKMRDEAREDCARILGERDDARSDEAAQANRAEAAEAQVERLKGVILWADGQNGEWPERKPGEGAYYWRKELMRRAALEAKP